MCFVLAVHREAFLYQIKVSEIISIYLTIFLIDLYCEEIKPQSALYLLRDYSIHITRSIIALNIFSEKKHYKITQNIMPLSLRSHYIEPTASDILRNLRYFFKIYVDKQYYIPYSIYRNNIIRHIIL